MSSCHFYMTDDSHTSDTVLITQVFEPIGPTGREPNMGHMSFTQVKKWLTIRLSQGQGLTSHQ